MSKSFLEITARVPLPDDLMDAADLQTGALAIGKKFRDELAAFGKEKKIAGVTVESKVAKTKEARQPRKPKAAPAVVVAA